ncbi:GNAT family N-acetyltransferase [Streptomyces sp. Go40/10]|uniref:GNAT family N-acetyltransferase n=1 Tax=Streptomyces sp. Go40/10 TaxID=2825844 RepID=UPI001E284CC4|nr:GNAT family N-acetyltransferase [Streptomyces sp. Go40/10]UFR06958.1 GNAT family N-acetyltransferase [Streptomyces sp. Go40/10]
MPQGQTAESVLAAHRDRLRPIDRMIPEAGALPDPSDGEELLEVSGAQGLLTHTRVDPDALEAVLGPLDRWELTPRVSGPDEMAALLTRWQQYMESHPERPGADSMAAVEWPSRDVGMTRVLRAFGFVPEFVMIGRLKGTELVPESGRVRVRRATVEDSEAVFELQMVETRFDAAVSGAVERDTTEALLREEITASFKRDEPLIWVAEYEGEIVGMHRGEDFSEPQQAWLATKITATPVAHLVCQAVKEGYRSLGIGTSLAHHVHADLDAMGIGAAVGYHAMFNPISTPFWHRHGWRPYWNRWMRTPAV